MPIDPFGRSVDYLRLSVTDRCNLRCVYCLPEGYGAFGAAGETLIDDEIVGVVSCFAQLGFRHLRVTGGEPLVRPGLPALLARLSRLPGIETLALSTNGTLLAGLAAGLKEAGLHRVNVSLDTLDPDKFGRIARFGRLSDVHEGLERALSCGLMPLKINVVVARGFNEDEIGAFARLTEERPLHVRFIELMPMGETGFFSPERVVPMAEILKAAGPVEALPPEDWPPGRGPARYFRRPGARGTIGVISAMSCNFCAACNRVRLSAQGTLVPCLDGADGVSLRDAWRAGAGPEGIKKLIRETVDRKPERHFMLERAQDGAPNQRFMCSIGG